MSKICEYHDIDDPVCGKPATHISCMPYRDTPTCEEHTCRCAKPIVKKPYEPPKVTEVTLKELLDQKLSLETELKSEKTKNRLLHELIAQLAKDSSKL